MAYKFQVGPAILSGSTTFEEAVSAASLSSAGASTAATLSASAGVSGASFSADGRATVGSLTLGGVAVTATAAELNYLDDDDLTAADLTKLAAITATAAEINDLASNAVDADDLTKLSEVTSTSTELNLLDAVTRGSIIYGNASGASAKLAKGAAHTLLQSDGTDISYVAMSGDATLSAGVLTLAANSVDSAEITAGAIDLAHMSVNSVDSDQYVDGSIDLIHMSANSVDSDQYVDGSIDLIHMSANSVDSDQYVDGSIDTAHIADDQVTLAKMAGLARGKFIIGDSNGDPGAMPLGTAHQFLQSDGTDLVYVSLSGDATLAAGVLTIAANAVQTGMVHDDVATELAGDGLSAASGVMALDLSELTAAAINVAADSFAIIDADAANGSRKESFVDYATAIAGGGLTALNGGLLVTGNNVMAIADAGTLAAGYNIFADLVAAATVTLPASPEVGAAVTVKGKGGVSQSNYIQINKAGSQAIDGQGSIRIESEYGAVTMVYVGSNDWRIV